FVANNGQNNAYYTNNGDGTFTKRNSGAIVSDGEDCNGATSGDYDNDGDMDIYVANYTDHQNMLYENDGAGNFTRITTSAPTLTAASSQSTSMADYDGDGDLDILVQNYSDMNNNLFRNNGFGKHWLQINPVGSMSNRNSYGATITIKYGDDDWQFREIGSENGFGSQSSLIAEFGLGTSTTIDSIWIVWPSENHWDTSGVAVDQLLTIMEPNSPPPLPENLTGTAGDQQVTLSWDESWAPDFAKYRIYRGTASPATTLIDSLVGDASDTSYADTGLSSGATYYYRVTAVDDAGNESDYSNEISVFIYETLIDIDGNVYQAITIGEQTWMRENLKVTHYRNGEAVSNVTDAGTWAGLSTGAYCNYLNINANADTYGSLYNWYAINDARELAPEGWHIPSDGEWKVLEMYLGMSQADADGLGWIGTDEGGKLKEIGTAHWDSPNTGATNTSGFTALPGGGRDFNGLYDHIRNYGAFWSASENDNNTAWKRTLQHTHSDIDRYNNDKKYGLSVRCLKNDQIPPAIPQNLAAEAGNAIVNLTWDAVADVDLSMYHIYRGSETGVYTLIDSVISDTSYADNSVTNSTTYYYVIKAVDTSGNSSAAATEVNSTPFSPFITANAGLAAVTRTAAEWADLNADGYLDLIYMGHDIGNTPMLFIYLNDGDGTFSSLSHGIAGLEFGTLTVGDYDGDGDIDLFITGDLDNTDDKKAELYLNDGLATFTLATTSILGVTSGSAAWGDYDNDGDLDLYLSGYHGYVTGATLYDAFLYRNDGNQVFTTLETQFQGLRYADVAWCDYDNDGDLDLIASGLSSGNDPMAILYINYGNGTFGENTSMVTGIKGSVDWGDYDQDGDADLLVTGDEGGMWNFHSRIYRNNGNGILSESGLIFEDVGGGNASFGDYDNDGDLDIILIGGQNVTNDRIVRVIVNHGNDTFSELDVELLPLLSKVAIWGDYDNDQDLDFFYTGTDDEGIKYARLYHNQTDQANTLPTAPVNLSQTVTTDQVDLEWEAGSDNETATDGLSYNLRIGTTANPDILHSGHVLDATGTRLIAKPGQIRTNLTWSFSGLPDGNYNWSAQTLDNGLGASAFASDQAFTIAIPPGTPQNLAVEAGNMQVTLTWDPVTDTDLVKYRIYRDTTSPAVTLIDSNLAASPPDTFFVDTGLTNDQIYYYRITAVDEMGNASEYSTEVQCTPLVVLWTVRTDGTGDFTLIQDAIDASSDGDTVLVYPGTYVENINFNGHNIVVGSLFLTTQDTSYISSTIIDGNQAGSVVTFES
ncbi:MAG: FG-GAP-like repeat-containing protein, partial [Candidatus Marinimicrobia bacterium]|nr:FG-GAP-like repeat-containing protein [Candidatus Neomarinimicrobiota bacterium]